MSGHSGQQQARAGKLCGATMIVYYLVFSEYEQIRRDPRTEAAKGHPLYITIDYIARQVYKQELQLKKMEEDIGATRRLQEELNGRYIEKII